VKILGMKRLSLILFMLATGIPVWAQNEIKPDGQKLLWFAIIISLAVLFYVFALSPFKLKRKTGNLFSSKKKVNIELKKDRLYYPDELELTIENTGKKAVDIEQPMLVFSSIWVKRKFRIKGTNNASLYPLYLDKGQSHTLTIDLNRFYSHSKSLRRLPKARVIVFEVEGKKLGSQHVFLRKTLFNI
jgi:hypothetical protein